MNYKVRREIEVAFSKHAQPVAFRVFKYLALGILFYFFYDSKSFWVGLGIFFILGLMLHFWYRHKTNGWTKSYGLWDYEKNKSKLVIPSQEKKN